MENANQDRYRKIVIIIATLFITFVLMLIIASNSNEEIEETGGAVYYNEIGILNNKMWYVRYDKENKAYSLYCYGEDEIQYLFPEEAISPTYSAYDKCFYYIHSDTLYAYDPVFKQNTELFDLSIQPCAISTVTEDHICLCEPRTGNPIGILDLYNGTITNLQIEQGTDVERTFSAGNNKFFFWLSTDTKEILCMFHCYDNSMDTVAVRDKKMNESLISVQLYRETIYYAESDGTLYSVKCTGKDSYGEPEIVPAIQDVIAMAFHEDGLICAKLNEENKIDFVLLSESGNVIYLGTWENDRYIVPGSCQMVVVADKLACVITTEEEAYFEIVFER